MTAINNICSKNVEICQDNYGTNSIYCVRVIYTLFTARLHEATSTNSNIAMKMMAEMIHDKQPVKANQFLYKAILINSMFMMQSMQSEQAVV